MTQEKASLRLVDTTIVFSYSFTIRAFVLESSHHELASAGVRLSGSPAVSVDARSSLSTKRPAQQREGQRSV